MALIFFSSFLISSRIPEYTIDIYQKYTNNHPQSNDFASQPLYYPGSSLHLMLIARNFSFAQKFFTFSCETRNHVPTRQKRYIAAEKWFSFSFFFSFSLSWLFPSTVLLFCVSQISRSHVFLKKEIVVGG